ncbi:MAG TPA: MFS transporter [Tepidisphaeraceae bacterium]|jgi:MFS family permease|nr:MFS transporter [Tepidisphaeraceae bacterium]
MAIRSGGVSAVSTLVLSTLLHAFTHAFAAMLVPLYLLMQADLHLHGVQPAAIIVTVYGTVYMILSYPAGVMADRVSRKRMLGVGLVLNAVAIALMGLTRSYEVLIALAVLAGIAGTVFHPAANALVPEHFPKSPGMAIGLLGIGSGLGFFAGPQYAGWRAESAHWHWQSVANWQRPCLELGAAGLVAGILFLIFAKEARPKADRGGSVRIDPPALGKKLRWGVVATAAVLGCRDFAGVACLTLASIYLQKAMKLDAKETGLIIGTMMLTGVVVNPLAVWLSPGRRRLPGLAIVLVIAGGTIATVPFVANRFELLIVLCVFQALQLGSYAMSDAGMLERVPANVRGRVVGLFLSIAGTFAALSPWVMGFWVDTMGDRAHERLSYLGPFGLLGAMMVIAAFSTPIIAKLGAPDEKAISPLSEIMPATLEIV